MSCDLTPRFHTSRVSLWLEWKPADCWIGAYWETYDEMDVKNLDLWICLVPMLPIHVVIWGRT